MFLILAAPLVFAESHEELIDRAFESIEDNPSERWSFTRTDSDGESTFIGHFDPRLAVAEQWNLVSIDGRAPDADEIENYRKERGYEEEDDSDGSEEYRSIMKEGSATLIDETNELIDGTLIVSSIDPCANPIEVELLESTSPHGSLDAVFDHLPIDAIESITQYLGSADRERDVLRLKSTRQRTTQLKDVRPRFESKRDA